MENGLFDVVKVTGNSAKKVYFKWTIKNFHHFVINGVTITSPEFQIMLYSDCTTWKIQLLPKFISGHRYFSAAGIVLIKATQSKIVVDMDFKLFNSLGENLDFIICSKAEVSNGDFKGCCSKILWSAILPKISHDNQVTLFINVQAFLNNHPALISELPISNSESAKSSTSDDFAKLLISGEFSDFTISVRGKEFHAHKIILAARSPVFSTMFKHEMKEANSGKVEIEDIEPEVFEEFLKYIYTGKGNINDNACELLATADKYDVRDLKAFCENALIMNLSPENCFKILNLSDIYSAHDLKKEAIKFIVSNNRISDKNGLDQITNVSLSKELIEAFVNQKK